MLHIHRAERADGLVEALGRLLADPLPDPFAPDVISVPTRGMERWLTQRLSASLGATPGRADGVCANVEFPFPHRLVGDAVATASGIDPDADPWSPAARRLAAARGRRRVPRRAVAAQPARSTSATRDDADRRARRFATVRHLAELFDRYALHRPEMVRGWARGEVDLSDEAAWQAELWQPAAPAARRAEPRRAARAGVRAAASGPLARRPPRAHLALRPDAAPGRPPRRPARARRRPRGPRLPPPPVARAVGQDRRPAAGRPPRRRPHRRARRQPPARLLGPGRARDAARARHRTSTSRTTTRSTRPSRHAARAHPGRRPRRPPPGARDPPRSRPTAASRSTPATAAPARSRSCATRSSTCSTRTTRCSRAT